jgi:hypothetical protein
MPFLKLYYSTVHSAKCVGVEVTLWICIQKMRGLNLGYAIR